MIRQAIKAVSIQRLLVRSEFGGATVSQYDYSTDAAGRRTEIARSGTAMTEARADAYGYNDRSELISRLAVAESRVGRAWKMISLTIPKADEEMTPETFRWSLDWERIREARAKDEGTYLLRTNLEECDPKTLWRKYMIQGEIEYAFRELKGDLGLRPVYHQLEDRIEAHIFTSFMALCLLTTLRALARQHAPGLTPRQIIEKMKTVKMVDVVMPTTDGRVVTLPRYVEPKKDVAMLLGWVRFLANQTRLLWYYYIIDVVDCR